MSIVVESSADQVQAYTEGKGVFPVPPEVAADRAAQAKKAEDEDPVKAAEAALAAVKPKPEAKTETKTEAKTEDDDIEDERGLTPRQKRDFSEAMLKTIAKKHRAQKEAEEFATSQFNQRTLAETQAQTLARENAELKARLTPKVEEVKEPVREDFKDDKTFWDAMVDYRVDQKLKMAQAKAVETAEENRRQEIASHAKAKIERAIELVPDFKEVTESIDTPIPPYVAGYMQESELFAELGYHFAIHPEDLERLSKMTAGVREGTNAYTQAVTKQLVALGKIESTLKPFAPANGNGDAKEHKPSTDDRPVESETGTTPSKPRVNAPIIAPLTGTSAAQISDDEANLTGSQVTKIWQKKHGVVLTARKRH